MTRLIFAAIIAFAVALVQGAFMPSLQHPWTAIDLPLILIVRHLTMFRFREAWVTAAVTGIVLGTLSAAPAGTHLAAYAASTGIALILFTRIFTNRSLPGLLGLTAAAYVSHHAVLALLRFFRALVGGLPASLALGGATFAGALAAIGMQLAATIALALLAAWGTRAAGRVFGRRFTRR